MPFLELFDETLDINSTENYELSVQMSPDGLAFCILDIIRNKYVLLRSSEPEENKYFTSDTINDLVTKDDFLSKRYKKVSMVMPSSKFTLVPAPLFDPGKKEEYFKFNLNKDETDIIIANKLSDPDAYVVFAVQKSLLDISGHLFPGTHPFHHTKPLLNQLSHSSRNVDGFLVHVHIEREFFNIFVYEHSSLKFSNTFYYRNINDIIYYVLNVFKGMKIAHEEALNFSGITEKYDDIYSGFAMYIRNIKFTGPSGNFTFSYVFNDIELHRYINLFTVTNCE